MLTLHGVQNTLRQARAEYQAALPSRFKRQRLRLGGTANAHFATPHQYREIREYARDMARNDGIVKSLTWKAVDNIVRTGFRYDPNTGDSGLDAELKAWWREWADDKRACDARGLLTFNQMTRLALYQQFLDGDIFAILTEDGQVQLVEGDWVSSPMALTGNVFHGVEIDDIGKPLRYWFLKQEEATRFSHSTLYAASDSQVRKVDAYDANGWPNVLHLFTPDRVTQNRGICVYHPVFDRLGMIEDADFARLVQQQIVSCFAVFLEMDAKPQHGGRDTSTNEDDGTNVPVEDIQPGTITKLRPGEKPHAFSPAVPNAEYFQYIKLQLRIIGATIGLPLEIALGDTSDTTFHGYRGAMQQAYIGFLCRQTEHAAAFCREVYRWKLAQMRPQLGRAARDNPRLFDHRWHGHGFPYVDPKTDAEADKIRLETGMGSPRRIAMERGFDWDETTVETITDRTVSIAMAIEKAEELSKGTGQPVTWRDILHQSPPQGVTFSGIVAPDEQEPAPQPPNARSVSRLRLAISKNPALAAALRAGDSPPWASQSDVDAALQGVV